MRHLAQNQHWKKTYSALTLQEAHDLVSFKFLWSGSNMKAETAVHWSRAPEQLLQLWSTITSSGICDILKK